MTLTAIADNRASSDESTHRASPIAWWSLGVLVFIGLYVVLDRQVFVLQIETIRRQMGLNDFQIGLVQGLSVALFSAVAGYPIAWIADRLDRRIVLSICILIWSLAVAACGLAQNFTGLFFASAMVAAGEAGVLPIAYALIPELFQGKQRVLANSIFAVGGRLGQGMVLSLCGYLIYYVDTLRPSLPLAWQGLETWRLAFFAAALPGILVIGLVMSMSSQAKSSTRSEGDLPQSASLAHAEISVLTFIRSHWATFSSFFLGMGLLVFGLSAIGAFLPVVAMRQMGATPVQVGNFMGVATFTSSLLGLVLTQLLAKYLRPRLGDHFPIVVLTCSSLLTALATSTFLAVHSVAQLFFVMGIQMTFLMCGMMTFPNAIQDMTPRHLRARLVAVIIMVNTVSSSLSPALVGAISDQLKDRPDGLLQAAVGTSCISLLLAAAVLWHCQRTYTTTVAAAKATELRAD